MQPIPGVARAIIVASGKGGVGKTTVTLNLALALQRLGARVGIFDADLYGPNVPIMLGIERASAPDTMVPIARAGQRAYIDPVLRFGLTVMSMGFLVGRDQAVSPDPRFAGRLIVQTLRDTRWGELDYLLIDSPPGTGEPQTSIVADVELDGAMVVTTPSDLALLDAGRAVAAFRRDGVPLLGVIENMAYLHCPHCGEEVPLHYASGRSTAGDLDVPVIARVPTGPRIGRIIGSAHPLLDAEGDPGPLGVFVEAARVIDQRLRPNGSPHDVS